MSSFRSACRLRLRNVEFRKPTAKTPENSSCRVSEREHASLRSGIVKLLGTRRGLDERDPKTDDAGYAARLMPQTSCHASKAWARAARYSVAGMRWRGRRKRLLT